MAVAGEKLSDSLVRDLVRFYESAEKDILNKINAIALKGDSPGTLAHLKTMRENIQQIKKQCQEANQSWVEQAIPRMYSEGLFMADIMLEDLDFMGKAGFGGIHTEAATVLMENTYNRLEDVVNTIGRQTDDIYRALALDHIKGTVLGYDTWTESAKSLQMDLDQRGVTGFIDRMGRKWNMSSYVQMVARTTTMEAHLQGTSNRLLEQGFDLVKVSSHSGACELCLPWEGQILSISGQSEEYPSLDEAKRQGLFHPNCRHAYGLHIDLDSDLFTELGIEPEEQEEGPGEEGAAIVAEETLVRKTPTPEEVEEMLSSTMKTLAKKSPKDPAIQNRHLPAIEKIMRDAAEKRPELMEFFAQYVGQVRSITPPLQNKTAYYVAKERSMVMDFVKMERFMMGPYTPFFHEYGHFLDNALARSISKGHPRDPKYAWALSTDTGYINALRKDFEALLGEDGKIKDSIRKDLISNNVSGPVQDTIQGYSYHARNAHNFKIGHSAAYWDSSGDNFTSEGFANMFQSLWYPETQEYMEKYLPESFAYFQNVLFDSLDKATKLK